jgi:hypothetical protein
MYGLLGSWSVHLTASSLRNILIMYRFGIYSKGAGYFVLWKDGHLNDELHLAEMVSLMGPPPESFLERSEKCCQYWDAEGQRFHNPQSPTCR